MKNRIRKLFFLMSLTAVCAGCGNEFDDLETPSLYAVAATTEYPAVVKVVMPGGRGLCTGTFVSPNAVLTAAHCVTEAGVYRVITSYGHFIPTGIRRLGDGSIEDTADLAILYFNSPIASPEAGQVMPIGSGLYNRAPVRLVGYGCNNLDTRLGSGTKRTGTNQVSRIADYVELTTPLTVTDNAITRGVVGPENRAGACFGDSGSPLLYSDGQITRVVGVGHAGSWSDEFLTSFYSDVNRTEHLVFFGSLDSELNLNLLNPCDVPGIRSAYCVPESAFAGIFTFLKWVWSHLAGWIL